MGDHVSVRVALDRQPTRGGESHNGGEGREQQPYQHEGEYETAACARQGCNTRPMAASDVALLRTAWEAFGRGDLEAVMQVLDPHVRWHGAGDDEHNHDDKHNDGCRNRDEALAFIRRALADGVTAEAFDFRDAGDRVVILLQAHQPHAWGEQPGPHGEVVTVRDGKVVEIVVYPTVDEALAAAGLSDC